MIPATLEAALLHARADAPRESCGLLVQREGREDTEYFPCRSLGGEDHFDLHPEDWASAEDSGEILGVVHSHPGGEAIPSEADKHFQAATGLPWWIVVPETGTWCRFGEEGNA